MANLKYLPNIIRTLRREKIIRNFLAESFFRGKDVNMAEKHMHALSGLVKAISAFQQSSQNIESTVTTQSSQNSTSNDVETAIRSLFPSTNGTAATVQNASSESESSRRDNQTNVVNSVDRQFVGQRARFQQSQNYQPRGKKRAKSTKVNAKKTKHVEQRSTIKDVILLPGPKFNKVPRGATREGLYTNGFVTTLELIPTMSEQEIRENLEEKFKRKLLGAEKVPKFEFVRAINSKIICARRQDCQSYDGRLLKHISGQAPLYIRATTDISSSLNMFNFKNEESSDGSQSNEEEVDEQDIIKSTMFKKEQKPCVVHIDDSDTNTTVSFLHGSTLPSTSNEQACTSRHPTSREQACLQHPGQTALQPTLAKEVETGPFVSCPTCDGQFEINEIEEHADRCAESTWHESERLIYANLMSSFENNSDTEMQHDETHTQSEAPEETVSASGGTHEISRGKLIEVIQELQKNVGMSTNRINVQRKTVLADYLNTRKRRPWFKPEDRIKVVFIGETAIDDGGPKREFFTGIVHYMDMCISACLLKLLKTWFNFGFVKPQV